MPPTVEEVRGWRIQYKLRGEKAMAEGSASSRNNKVGDLLVWSPEDKTGHKTGTGQDLGARTAGFNDVGILTAPDGKSYALAIMIGDTHRPVRERQMLMQQVAQAIVTHRN